MPPLCVNISRSTMRYTLMFNGIVGPYVLSKSDQLHGMKHNGSCKMQLQAILIKRA
jgi:hypothetical protein